MSFFFSKTILIISRLAKYGMFIILCTAYDDDDDDDDDDTDADGNDDNDDDDDDCLFVY